MANSGSKSVAATSHDTLKFSWSESSQSVANNTTTISWKLQLIADSYGRISSKASKDWSVTVNGKKYSGTNKIGISNNSTITLASGTTTITHNSDGTKTFSYSFSQEFAITFSGSSVGTISGSGSGTLDTIPRKSSLSVDVGTLGTALTLTIKEEVSSFKHTLQYTCGDETGFILGGYNSFSTANSVSWTPPLSLAQHNKNGTSVIISFTLSTYTDSGTYVGYNTYMRGFTIPASVKPSVSVAVSDAMGYAGKYGAYVQGLSKLKIVSTASGNQGSTINSYNVEAAGKTYTEADVTTDAIAETGTLTIKSTVTDTRQRTATDDATISVLAYEYPKISALTVYRCDSAGKASPSGEYLAVKFSSAITALNNKNTAVYTVTYKKSSAALYPASETVSDYAGKYSVTNGVYVFPAETTSSYDVILTVKDDFKSVSKSAFGSSVKKVWSLLKKAGDIVGIAIGKIAELEGVLDVDFVIRARKGIVVDAEWVDLTIADGFALYDGIVENKPKYKVTGNVVTVMGVLTPETEFTSSTAGVAIASGIPSNLRPTVHLQFVCQGSSVNRWTCSITKGGSVTVSRYGTTELAKVPAGAWLPFCVTYQI